MEDVKQALRRRLDDPEFDLEPVGERVGGSVISATFFGMGDRGRQRLMWDALDEAFGAAESARRVSGLLGFSPQEWAFSVEPDRRLVL